MPRRDLPPDEELLATSRFRVLRRHHQLANGKIVKREVIEHGGAVVVLPIVVGDDGAMQVCLIRNHRVAVGRTLVELPAGTLESGEDPAECARRELAEETGYRAKRIEKACQFFMSPGILNELMHLYIATGLTAGETELEESEEIELLVVPWEEAMAMVLRGEVEDSKSLVGLLWYEAMRGK